MNKSVLTYSIVFVSIVFLSSCGKVNTSSSNDKTLYGSSTVTTSNFTAAKAVLSQNCFQCHDWATYAESDFSAQALVIPDSAVSSRLYQKLKGNDSGTTGNMPPSGALTSDDLIKIRTWINGM